MGHYMVEIKLEANPPVVPERLFRPQHPAPARSPLDGTRSGAKPQGPSRPPDVAPQRRQFDPSSGGQAPCCYRSLYRDGTGPYNRRAQPSAAAWHGLGDEWRRTRTRLRTKRKARLFHGPPTTDRALPASCAYLRGLPHANNTTSVWQGRRRPNAKDRTVPTCRNDAAFPPQARDNVRTTSTPCRERVAASPQSASPLRL